MSREPLYFDAIKEDRGSYFIEYQTPVANNPFATLNVVYPGAFELNQVADSMRTEMVHWLARYPVPVIVSAFDVAENIIRNYGENYGDSAFNSRIQNNVTVILEWSLCQNLADTGYRCTAGGFHEIQPCLEASDSLCRIGPVAGQSLLKDSKQIVD